MQFKDLARVEIDGRTICLDMNGDISYISHAHSDHVSGKKKDEVIASDPTISLADIVFNSKLAHDYVRLHPAGHMLGATQIEIQKDGGNFVYTGDFSIADGFTYKGAEIVEADELLIESTYGSPDYHFPKKEDIAQLVRKEVLSRLKYGNVIFAVYAKGKSQELIRMLNEFCNITPVVSPEVARISQVYVKHGQNLSFISSHSEEAGDVFRDNFVGIIPKSQFRPELKIRLTQHYRKPCYFGSLSGWNAKFPSDVYDIALPLSDHADFNDLIEYVDHSNPKKVYVFGAFAETLANVLKLRGYQSFAVR
ncbi:MAG: MBL fold metallo-hydrolase [Candidatus Micrarchaeia archaeon]